MHITFIPRHGSGIRPKMIFEINIIINYWSSWSYWKSLKTSWSLSTTYFGQYSIFGYYNVFLREGSGYQVG